MPRASLPKSHEAIRSLAESHRSLGAVIHAEPVDLVELGKGLEDLVQALHQTIKASGRTSVRLEAAELALDLKTTKSSLIAFIESASHQESSS